MLCNGEVDQGRRKRSLTAKREALDTTLTPPSYLIIILKYSPLKAESRSFCLTEIRGPVFYIAKTHKRYRTRGDMPRRLLLFHHAR